MEWQVAISVIIWLLVAFCVAAAFLPFTRLPHGAIQGLGFFRVQMLALMAATSGLTVIYLNGSAQLWSWAVLSITGLTNLFYIAKFTPLWKVQSIRPERGFHDLSSRTVTILVSNVKQSNRAYQRFMRLIDAEQPDIIVAVETDQLWLDALASLKDSYGEAVEAPLDTGYGMALYARLPLAQTTVTDRITAGVPSIRAAVQLRSGAWFRLYAVHPEPPVPHLDTKGCDSEIALAGLEAKDDALPTIVTGDLNDVAWSTTTRRFQRLSGLLDPRVGRGFYATFNAYYPIFRWPLDHLFHDPKFRLVNMRRLSAIGSDHFPMLYSVALSASEGGSLLPDAPKSDEVEEVVEMIEETKAEDRAPIGTDWEQG